MSNDYAGHRLPRHQVRDARLQIAADMLSLTLKDTALLPVRQQQQVRLAVQALHEVREWCRSHSGGGAAHTSNDSEGSADG
jgi:hypothetical protein